MASPSGFWSFAWLAAPTESANASGLLQALLHGRFWLWPMPVLLVIALIEVFAQEWTACPDPCVVRRPGAWLHAASGLCHRSQGVEFRELGKPFWPHRAADRAWVAGPSLSGPVSCFFCRPGSPSRAIMRGDVFLVSSIAVVVAAIGLFVFFPVMLILIEAAMSPEEGGYSLICALRSPVLSRCLECDLEQPHSRDCGRACHHTSRPWLRAPAQAHGFPRQGPAASSRHPADHHAAFRHRPRHHSALRPQRHGDLDAQRISRHSAEPLDLWLLRPAAGADAGLHAHRLSGADRRRRRHQPLDGGGGPDLARQSLANLRDRDVAADAAGPRQCLPDRLRGKSRRFRQSPGARRQF